MERSPDALAPEVARRCRALMEECRGRGIPVTLTSTRRTPGEQAALYSQGRKPLRVVNALRDEAGLAPIALEENRVVTHATTSTHLYGLAFDIALLRNGRPSWDADALAGYREAGSVGEGLGLVWGGRFRNRDMCHFEWTGGLTLAELSAGKAPTPTQAATAKAGPEQASIPKEESQMATEKIKSGIRSTEFYLALIGATIPVLNTYLGLAIPVEGVLGLAGVIISYIVSRTVAKRA